MLVILRRGERIGGKWSFLVLRPVPQPSSTIVTLGEVWTFREELTFFDIRTKALSRSIGKRMSSRAWSIFPSAS